jgi:hypothetical protein
MSDTSKTRLDELRMELNLLMLQKYEHNRRIIHIQKQIAELEKMTCESHIWRDDKYDLQYCCLCYTFSVKK